jgi:hypothetical protein
MQCAFLRSDYLYGARWDLLFKDDEVRELVKQKFASLAAYELEVARGRLDEFSTAQTNPFPFPHADSTIYKKNMYVVSRSGAFRATCNKKTRHPISSRTEKKWDAPIVAVAASYNSLAFAAGDEGLFELEIKPDYGDYSDRTGPKRLSSANCIDCNWAFYSIYGSSHVKPGYLAAFSKHAEDSVTFHRQFEGLISDARIFRTKGYSWGCQDKLCQATTNSVRAVRYAPWEEDTEDQMQDLGTIQLAEWKGEVISGGVALFGTIIECENAVVVVPSEGPAITIPGEPVNWRIFPRSKHYENQLHLIYHDRLEILSFNHDYFVDQKTKSSGLAYREYFHRT